MQEFLSNYGLAITLIALGGVILLGILKYGGAFKKLAEDQRHYMYIGISVTITIVATIIYLCITMKQFPPITYILGLAGATYALNQTFYNIFKVTPLKELFRKIIEAVLKSASNKK